MDLIEATKLEMERLKNIYTKEGNRLTSYPEDHEGESICSECGAKYIGINEYCTTTVPKVYDSSYGYGGSWQNLLMKNKDYTKLPHIYKKFQYTECRGRTFWNLRYQRENALEEYNALLNVNNIQVYDNSEVRVYDSLNDETKDMILKKLYLDNQYLMQKVLAMTDALNEIAEKIHNAGNSLRF